MVQRKTGQQIRTSSQETPKYLWRSGELVEWDKATVHISALGWTAISSVFEGIRAYWSPDHQDLYVFHLYAHLTRLFQSMKILRMTSPYSAEGLVQGISEVLGANEYRTDA